MKFATITESWITPKSDMGVVHFTDKDDKKQFRASVRHSNGLMEWEWFEKEEDALAWCRRIKGVDLCDYLRNILNMMSKSGSTSWDIYRGCGAIECALLVAGEFSPPPFVFKYGMKEVKPLFGKKKKVKESYPDLMRRLANEYLEKNDSEIQRL